MSAKRLVSSKPWRVPLFLSGLVLLSQAFPLPSPVRDAATFEWVTGVHLVYPVWHLVFTPFCSLADTLTVLGYHEGIAVLVWAFVLIFWLGGLKRGAILSLCFLAFLAWGALIPRPMGRLVAEDPNTILLDFHSHTSFSHDGRPSFTPQANMLWHQAQGYNAAFITDHNLIEASAWAKEKSRADWRQTGYRSLEGEEVSLQRTHLVILGNHEKVDNRPYDADPNRIPVFVADMRKKGYPVIASIPEYWWYHWPGKAIGGDINDFARWGMEGFEIINSAPKAMDFPLAKRLEVIDLCRHQNLFMTGISDNHGYGYATAAWNAMPMPGWQSLDPDQLEAAVIKKLRTDRYSAVQVLERVRYIPESTLGLIITPFAVLFLYWRLLQPLQALSWVFWTSAISLLLWKRRSS